MTKREEKKLADFLAGRDDGRLLERTRRIGPREYRNGFSLGLFENVRRCLQENGVG